MAAAEGPLARIGEAARSRSKSRTILPRERRQAERRQADRRQAEPALVTVGVEVQDGLSQPPGEPDTVDESQESAEHVDSVTEQVALEQEIDILRRMLREKERVLDATAAQCRSLEDELEDRHLAYDGLKQELERKARTLAAEREQAVRVSQERNEIEERYQALLSSRHGAELTDGPAGKSALDPFRSATRFFGGLAVGALLAAVAFGVWVKLDSLSTQDDRALGEPEAELPAKAPQQTAPPAPARRQTAPDDASATEGVDPRPVSDEEQSGPAVLGTVRDRLSDGSSGPLMVKLQGRDFTMGKQRALPDNDEGPAHGVHLDGFLIGSAEVTFEEYDRFVRSTGGRFPNDYGWGRGRRPAVDVSWKEAGAYAKWLSKRTGRRYRLPSEAEWEYAAAAGERSTFWWGYQPEPNRAVCFDCGTRWDNRSTAPVRTFDPNPLGLYDTAGNVMEWVQDCYHPNYSGAPANGQPWGGESCRFRVARGGAFNKPARSMRTTARNRLAPDTRINSLGFRLARDE